MSEWNYTPSNLFEQLTSVERQGVAQILGFEESAGFRINLREMPPVENKTMGEIAEIYCERLISQIRARRI